MNQRPVRSPCGTALNRRVLTLGGVSLSAALATGGLIYRGVSADAPSSPTPATATAETSALVSAAEAFLATLNSDQQDAVQFNYPNGVTAGSALDFNGRYGEQFGDAVWSNYPISDVTRPGLRMGDLSDDQRAAALRVLAAALSSEGLNKVQNIMGADQVLASGGTNYASGSDNYVIGLFGAPSAIDRWMIQFGGHHLALNIAVQDDQLSITPTLTGSQPSSYERNGVTIRPLGDETDDAFALVNALSADLQAKAILSYDQSDLVLGPGHDGQWLQPEGLAASAMSADQQDLLIQLAGHWVGIANASFAEPKLQAIRDNLSDTYFAWSGPTELDNPIYFRITSPVVHIEFANQGSSGSGGQTGGPGTGGNPQADGTPQAGGPQNGPAQRGGGTPQAGTLQGGSAPANGTPQAASGGGGNPYETGGVNHIHTIFRDPTNEYGLGLTS